ncbi:MAG: hypothetical protein KC621_07405 [Myxococcales bacterium]|nr:hypothetical protein [Myxococcales bacterium]
MLLSLMSFAQAVEPCMPTHATFVQETSVRVAWYGLPEDPTKRTFVVNETVTDAFARAGRTPTVTTDAIPLTKLPGGQRMETALLLGGATRPGGGDWRLGGASPRFYLDGIPLSSNLE